MKRISTANDMMWKGDAFMYCAVLSNVRCGPMRNFGDYVFKFTKQKSNAEAGTLWR